ncbi:MAG: N-methylhydantoinase A [Gammaproteobacteria bacterium]|jgi:N-methylhydantoinase A
MSFVIGVDIGGTFTDCIVINANAPPDHSDTTRSSGIVIGKAPSTPPDFHTGFIDAIRAAAVQLNLTPAELVVQAQGIYHGCTVGTNALVEHRTAKVGLLTTRGHADAIFFMRSGGRLKYLPAAEIAHVASHTKPPPLIPKQLIEEIDERVTFDGNVLVELNLKQAGEAVERLIDSGVEAIAISLVWSVANDAHEQALAKLIEAKAPELFVSISSEVIPRVGEYERTVATVVNALIGPAMGTYLEQLEKELSGLGYARSVQIMSCSGGLMDARFARSHPILTIGSGPVAGLIGAASLAAQPAAGGGKEIITADMGGTTFDVGVVTQGKPLSRAATNYGQYEYFVPTLDVRSVGAGGGSIIACEAGAIRVGPRSAGARPGPACYANGGLHATVTDANLILGYLNPDYFLGGAINLDIEAARSALERAGAPLGFGAEETAAAAARIVDNQMADAIRLASVQQGNDPRGFAMYAYGGAGPVHATALARELGITTVVVPLSDFAAAWSAFGIASSDALVVTEFAIGITAPFDPTLLNDVWQQLETEATERLLNQGINAASVQLERVADMKYTAQVHQIEVSAPDGPYDERIAADLTDRFAKEYERIFGRDSGYPDAGISLTGMRVRALAQISNFSLHEQPTAKDPTPSAKGERSIIFYESGLQRQGTPIFEGRTFRNGMQLSGPAIVEYADTTIVLRAGDSASVDNYGSVIIEVKPEQSLTQKETS